MRILILLTLSAATWGDEGTIADCLDVAGKMERLVCYDERAREYRREHGVSVTSSPQAPPAQTSSAPKVQTSSAPTQTSSAPTAQTSSSTRPQTAIQTPRAAVVPVQSESEVPAATTIDSPQQQVLPNEENFGKLELISAPKQLATRIESIIKAPLGNYVMTLSNGQIWSENEPNIRRITAGQAVTITKRRFHYEMRLESGRRVPVRRIDTD
ncbi:MAG: hypothetical protein O7F71_19595 [Gammaproteobacteria bacterium]|nr:hypothetical protein [Gammaproteobacteria bacterium]